MYAGDMAVWFFHGHVLGSIKAGSTLPLRSSRDRRRRKSNTFLPYYTAPIIFFNLINQTIQALQNFTSAQVITEGGPLKSTYVLGLKLYKEGFSYFKMGYASAISWVVFAAIMIFTLAIFASSKLWVHYADE